MGQENLIYAYMHTKHTKEYLVPSIFLLNKQAMESFDILEFFFQNLIVNSSLFYPSKFILFYYINLGVHLVLHTHTHLSKHNHTLSIFFQYFPLIIFTWTVDTSTLSIYTLSKYNNPERYT